MPEVEKEKKIVTSSDEDISDDNGDDAKQDSGEDETATSGAAGRGKMSRNEKKARQAIMRHGVKQIANINKVFIKKDRKTRFSIVNPDVYKSLTSETFIIFGEAKADDSLYQKQSEAAQRFTKPEGISADKKIVEEKVDSVQDDDVSLVMEQAGCSKEKALATLKKHSGDVVEAIMELSVDK